MDKRKIGLEIQAADLEAFVLCLGLGTLEAIRSGGWPTESAIWTLGRPVFRDPLEGAGLSEEVISVLMRADELSAMEELYGADMVRQNLEEWIQVLKTRLAELRDKSWCACWKMEETV